MVCCDCFRHLYSFSFVSAGCILLFFSRVSSASFLFLSSPTAPIVPHPCFPYWTPKLTRTHTPFASSPPTTQISIGTLPAAAPPAARAIAPDELARCLALSLVGQSTAMLLLKFETEAARNQVLIGPAPPLL